MNLFSDCGSASDVDLLGDGDDPVYYKKRDFYRPRPRPAVMSLFAGPDDPFGPGDATMTTYTDAATVLAVQRALNNRAGAGLVEDGKFGPATYAAIESWQRSRGVESPSGYITPLVLSALDIPIATWGQGGGTTPIPLTPADVTVYGTRPSSPAPASSSSSGSGLALAALAVGGLALASRKKGRRRRR